MSQSPWDKLATQCQPTVGTQCQGHRPQARRGTNGCRGRCSGSSGPANAEPTPERGEDSSPCSSQRGLGAQRQTCCSLPAFSLASTHSFRKKQRLKRKTSPKTRPLHRQLSTQLLLAPCTVARAPPARHHGPRQAFQGQRGSQPCPTWPEKGRGTGCSATGSHRSLSGPNLPQAPR